MERGTASSTAAASSTPTLRSRQSVLQLRYQDRDCFRPYFPDEQRLSECLEANPANSLAELKAAVLPANFGDGSSVGSDSGNQESGVRLRSVALTSVTVKGGVGKTSTCRLLCADEDVRKHFSGSALLWIDVGQCAIEAKVKVKYVVLCVSVVESMKPKKYVRTSALLKW